MHQMLANNPHIDPEIFTTTFIDGLKTLIRSVVLIQRPPDLDTAGSLALLQEEVLEDCRVVERPRSEASGSSFSRSLLKASLASAPISVARSV